MDRIQTTSADFVAHEAKIGWLRKALHLKGIMLQTVSAPATKTQHASNFERVKALVSEGVKFFACEALNDVPNGWIIVNDPVKHHRLLSLPRRISPMRTH